MLQSPKYRVVWRDPGRSYFQLVIERPTHLDINALRKLPDSGLGFDMQDVVRGAKARGEDVAARIFFLEIYLYDRWIPVGMFDSDTLRVNPDVRYAWQVEALRGWVMGACIDEPDPTTLTIAEVEGDEPGDFLRAVQDCTLCDQVVEVLPDRIIFLSTSGYGLYGESNMEDVEVDVNHTTRKTPAEWAAKYGLEPPSLENPRGWFDNGEVVKPLDEPINYDYFVSLWGEPLTGGITVGDVVVITEPSAAEADCLFLVAELRLEGKNARLLRVTTSPHLNWLIGRAVDKLTVVGHVEGEVQWTPSGELQLGEIVRFGDAIAAAKELGREIRIDF